MTKSRTQSRRLSLEALEVRWVLTPVIDVGEHFLLPNTPEQQIAIYVSGGDAVEGLNFYLQVADGGPEAAEAGATPPPGIDGPEITALDVLTGTVFAGNNNGATDMDGEDPDLFPQFEGRAIVTASGAVAASGLLATATIDTTGFTAGTWELRLGGTLNGATNFAGVPATIAEGRITILPAGDGALPENVLRLLYLVPSGRQAHPDAVENVQQAIVWDQDWYRDQMERYGFGPKTFQVETQPDGVTPLVHVVYAAQPDAYFQEDPGSRLPGVAVEAGLPVGDPGQVWAIVYEGLQMHEDGSVHGFVDLGSSSGSGDDPGIAMTTYHPLMDSTFLLDDRPYDGEVLDALGPYAMVAEVTAPWYEGDTFSSVSSARYGTLLHVISHAFGLAGDSRSDMIANGDAMGYGLLGFRGWVRPDLYALDDVRLSYGAALALSASRYFNAGAVFTDDTPPDVSAVTSGAVTLVGGQVEIGFTASDAGGLSAALLQYYDPAFGEFQTVAEMPLEGADATAALDTPYYSAGGENSYRVVVYDAQGNRTDAQTSVTPALGSNAAPQPFLTVGNSQVLVGQSVLLDGSLSFDPDNDPATLTTDWDLDGDLDFNDGASGNTLETTFDSPGARLVRVRVTDPGGASSVSPPLALRADASPVLVVPGTAGDDVFEFIAGPTNDLWIVKLNDATYPVEPYTTAVRFEGNGGDDAALLTGTPDEDALELRPDRATLSGTGYSVSVVDVRSITAHGLEGTDSALVYDSPGDDSLAASYQSLTISGPAFSHIALGFESVHAYATEGDSDVARLDDSPGDDTFAGTPDSCTLSGPGYSITVEGFPRVLAYAKAGGVDVAGLTGSAGSDRFAADPLCGRMRGEGFFYRAKFFAQLYASAVAGGADAATLYGSLGKDKLTASPSQSQLTGWRYHRFSTTREYLLAADGFATLTAWGGTRDDPSAGFDVAKLEDSSGDDSFAATPNQAALSGEGFSLKVRRFDSVQADARNGGNDTAELHGSVGSDTFAARPASAKLFADWYLLRAIGFDSVHAYAAAGGGDAARLSGSPGGDAALGTAAFLRLSGSGYSNTAESFDRVRLLAGEGDDSATLQEGAVEEGELAPGAIAAQGDLLRIAWLYELEQIHVERPEAEGGNLDLDAVDKVFTAYWQ